MYSLSFRDFSRGEESRRSSALEGFSLRLEGTRDETFRTENNTLVGKGVVRLNETDVNSHVYLFNYFQRKH